MNTVPILRQEEPDISFLIKQGESSAEADHTLWLAFRSGNRKALDYIFEKNVRVLFAYGTKLTRDYSLVEDCIQDVFVELWNKREVLSDTDNIRLYLLKSLRRRVTRVLSLNSRIQYDMLDEDGYDNELEFSAEFQLIEDSSTEERRAQLKQALANLSTRQREAVYLKFYEHLTYLEISDMMNLTVKSTYKLIGKAIDSLRAYIGVK